MSKDSRTQAVMPKNILCPSAKLVRKTSTLSMAKLVSFFQTNFRCAPFTSGYKNNYFMTLVEKSFFLISTNAWGSSLFQVFSIPWVKEKIQSFRGFSFSIIHFTRNERKIAIQFQISPDSFLHPTWQRKMQVLMAPKAVAA